MTSAETRGDVAGVLRLLINSSFLEAEFLSSLILHSTALQE